MRLKAPNFESCLVFLMTSLLLGVHPESHLVRTKKCSYHSENSDEFKRSVSGSEVKDQILGPGQCGSIGWSVIQYTERWWVRFLVRAPGEATDHIVLSLFLSLSLKSVKEKYIYLLIKKTKY